MSSVPSTQSTGAYTSPSSPLTTTELVQVTHVELAATTPSVSAFLALLHPFGFLGSAVAPVFPSLGVSSHETRFASGSSLPPPLSCVRRVEAGLASRAAFSRSIGAPAGLEVRLERGEPVCVGVGAALDMVV